MWKAILEKAITKSQIPKEYKAYEKNSSKFKGKLQISKHIKNNLIDKSKFYCKYRKLTMDTTINQTIRYTYKLLLRKQKGLSNILKDVAEYDNTLRSFGVQDKEVSLLEIQNIRYSKLNIYYKKVMELSLLIIKSESSKNDNKSFQKHGFSYFLDIAELWENYLLKVLQKNLPEYDIYSPNEKGGDCLIEDSFRQIRPDIIIENDGKIIAILDAKYKQYNKIGKTDNYIEKTVSREDLYQMNTYLYHYGNCDDNILGLFISPISGDKEVKRLSKNNNHKIGVINLNIQQFDEQEKNEFSLEAIYKEEANFIEKIKEELEI
jgi:5-methylcytosine-specific restriction enzyme subunit McrC